MAGLKPVRVHAHEGFPDGPCTFRISQHTRCGQSRNASVHLRYPCQVCGRSDLYSIERSIMHTETEHGRPALRITRWPRGPRYRKS